MVPLCRTPQEVVLLTVMRVLLILNQDTVLLFALHIRMDICRIGYVWMSARKKLLSCMLKMRLICVRQSVWRNMAHLLMIRVIDV
jgi:hypothetical protein